MTEYKNYIKAKVYRRSKATLASDEEMKRPGPRFSKVPKIFLNLSKLYHKIIITKGLEKS